MDNPSRSPWEGRPRDPSGPVNIPKACKWASQEMMAPSLLLLGKECTREGGRLSDILEDQINVDYEVNSFIFELLLLI